ncbi:Uncharacterized protein conserved in cyanobacteria [Gloeomargarita lithophora Alchichica-D10]|uniref:Uncharacterized protein conserved in cyanobacteria n=1 Tax=Gloeomargarita lithophora Alchichica-D10 TaxID=1188229 RepID=A0A1J0AE85_9CYAN|nr:Uma2 family endonuclease [Gloeomargarita lithophora]APB34245.1 Uncharacterized protein conserved in cyanobacteria [Gloeomargarita lithophora Alchichica-D10]
MILQIEPTKIYTSVEYLTLELESEVRHEYINGAIIPMTGGTPNHNDIAGNLYVLLKSALRQKNYRVFYVDQRLWIPSVNRYTYPDVMVVSKPIEFQSGRTDTLINFCLIAEVLSPSTQAYDRGDKFTAYRTMPTFTEYLLIDQHQIQVEHRVRTAENQWLISEYNSPQMTLKLDSIGIEIPIADLYADIDLDQGNLTL